MGLFNDLRRPASTALETTFAQLMWYLILATAAWMFFYVAFRVRFQRRRLSSRDIEPAQLRREIAHSLRSIAIFGLVTLGVLLGVGAGWSRMYGRIESYGWTWFVASIGVMVLMHDTYFYWTHRLMHHPRLYRLVHHTHHLSISPTPWAAYAFSPIEAIVQAGIGPLIVFTIPVHPLAFALFMIWQIAFNILGHCGYEFGPSWLVRSPIGRILNTVTHHHQHHEKFRSNFGLYFNVWDRIMGTNHPGYEHRFEAAAGHREPTASFDSPARTSEYTLRGHE